MKALKVLTLMGFFCAFYSIAEAHEVRPGYLEWKETSPERYEIFFKVPAKGDQLRLGLSPILPKNCINLAEPKGRYSESAYLETSSLHCPGGLAMQSLGVEGLRSTMTEVLLRVESLDGNTQVARLSPDAPSFAVAATPNSRQVAWTYLTLGIEHILWGIDHLLFVLALLLLVKGWRRLLATITAFTVAHSLTLAAATLGFVQMPAPPVEAVIALSIALVAVEIIHEKQGRFSLTGRYPWLIAFAFGLLHGFGFAGALSEVGLPQKTIPLALLFFNLGVEAGQLLFVGAVLTLIFLLRKLPLQTPRWTSYILPYAIGSLAMFWVIQRVAAF